MPTVLVAVACNLLWSMSYVFQKQAAVELSVLYIVAFRFLLGAAVLLPLIVYVLPVSALRISRKEFMHGPLPIGLICYCLSPALQVLGISAGKASVAGFIVACEPVFAVVLAVLFLKERPGKWLLPGLIIILIGVLQFNTDPASGFLTGSQIANLLILCSVASESLQGVFARKSLNQVHPLALALYSYLVGGLSAGLLAPFVHGYPMIAQFPIQSILYLGIVCTAIAYSLWYWVLAKMPLSQAALYIYVQPPAAAIMAYLILGETLGWKDFLGMGLIALGIAITQRRNLQ